jgi:hypothetical protein
MSLNAANKIELLLENEVIRKDWNDTLPEHQLLESYRKVFCWQEKWTYVMPFFKNKDDQYICATYSLDKDVLEKLKGDKNYIPFSKFFYDNWVFTNNDKIKQLENNGYFLCSYDYNPNYLRVSVSNLMIKK